MAANGAVPCVLLLGQDPMDKPQVAAAATALGDLPLQAHERILALGHHHAATGVLIQAVDNAGAHPHAGA